MEAQQTKKKRVIIEFWNEPQNLIKRSRVTVVLNENDVPFWNCPKRYVTLFNTTAVYIFYKKDWYIGNGFEKRKVVFLPVAPWEMERAYFKEKGYKGKSF